jgi:A/G-specific adenine glycosylase
MSKAKKTSPQLELLETRPPKAARPAPPVSPRLTDDERDELVRRELVAWFERVARDLPWRRRRDPYAVWLSEIMLQQTRVDTVVPYFERFIARFPEVSALSAAPIDEVLALWSGLGYYRRARQLHATAREVTERYASAFPSEVARLKELPGVGDYTAGAIASLAFEQREPLVDGNVARVFARLFGITAPIKSPPAIKELWQTARRLLPEARPGRFNEALMELGAMVCTPRDPRCEACPLERVCVARATGREVSLPVVVGKAKVPVVPMVAAVIRRGDEVLFARRKEGGLFGGLWEPPMLEATSLDEARAFLAAHGLTASLVEAGQVKHVLTHKALAVRVAVGRVKARSRPPAELAEPYEKAAFLDPEAAGVGVSTLARKILAAAAEP